MKNEPLSSLERIQARHVLQQAQERCVALRNALEPTGVVAVRPSALMEDLTGIIAPLLDIQVSLSGRLPDEVEDERPVRRLMEGASIRQLRRIVREENIPESAVIRAMTGDVFLVWSPGFEELLEAGSLGTEGARELRSRTPDDVRRRIVQRMKDIES